MSAKVCALCNATGKKMIKCSMINDICIRCCFAVSAGSPQLLDRLKKEKHLSKNDILKICSECNQELDNG